MITFNTFSDSPVLPSTAGASTDTVAASATENSANMPYQRSKATEFKTGAGDTAVAAV